MYFRSLTRIHPDPFSLVDMAKLKGDSISQSEGASFVAKWLERIVGAHLGLFRRREYRFSKSLELIKRLATMRDKHEAKIFLRSASTKGGLLFC